MEYTVLTGTKSNGEIATVLVYDLQNSDGAPEDYFLSGTTNVISHGEVEITGGAESMVPETLEG